MEVLVFFSHLTVNFGPGGRAFNGVRMHLVEYGFFVVHGFVADAYGCTYLYLCI